MKQQNIKTVEIRDRATLIPAFAIRMLPSDEKEFFLFKGAGYGFSHPCIMLIAIEAPWQSARSSDEWRNSPRTLVTAHKWIEKHFDEIENGDVIDVEFILDEKEKPSFNAFMEEAIENAKAFQENCKNE